MSHFNEVANDWDNLEKVKLMQKLAESARPYLKFDKKIDIMDFGCGTGLFGFEFYNIANTLTGIDTSSGMLAVFDKKAKDLANVKSLNIDLEANTINEKYDLIISSMAFHHLNNPARVLAKLIVNLKPGGKIAIVDLDKEDGTFHPDNEGMGVKHFGFSKDELQAWANEMELNFEHHLISSVHKNDRDYHQFLAIFS